MRTPLATLIMLLLLACPGCRAPGPAAAQTTPHRFEFARVMMGTRARIVLYAQDEGTAAAAAGEALDEMARLERVMSDYDPASEAMRLAAAPAGVWRDGSADLIDVLVKSRDVWRVSGGAFDPTIGPLTVLWREARRDARLPPPEVIEVARSRVGFPEVRLDPDAGRVMLTTDGMRLDFGGIGKGYAAGRALAILRRLGHPRALVELGGDMALGDAPPGERGWLIRVRTGLGEEEEVRLSGVGVATSGDLSLHVEIDGVRYSHILDPATGLGLTNRVAVTVTAPEPWLADALASAASVLGPDRLDRLRRRWPDARIVVVERASSRDRRPDKKRKEHERATPRVLRERKIQ